MGTQEVIAIFWTTHNPPGFQGLILNVYFIDDLHKFHLPLFLQATALCRMLKIFDILARV